MGVVPPPLRAPSGAPVLTSPSLTPDLSSRLSYPISARACTCDNVSHSLHDGNDFHPQPTVVNFRVSVPESSFDAAAAAAGAGAKGSSSGVSSSIYPEANGKLWMTWRGCFTDDDGDRCE